jgi:hypothetical protein
MYGTWQLRTEVDFFCDEGLPLELVRVDKN